MISIEEYRQRRIRLMRALEEAAGEPTFALLQGAPKEASHTLFRQYNDFHYLCPVETPHAYLLLDTGAGLTRLFLPHQSAERREQEGALASASQPEEALDRTGVDSVHSLDELMGFLDRARLLHTPMRAGEGAVQSWDTLRRSQQERIADPWDGRPDRMRWFVRLLRERLPATELRDLAPFLNRLRLVKSEAEIALLRRAGALSARGLIEAIRSTRPGIHEYQVEAVMRYVYLSHGARDVAYRAIVAGGDNAWYGHYNANDARLIDGDLILVDCGPDYRYYASDITRMWPVNGVYDAVQRELYGFMVAYHRALLSRLRPGVTAEWVRDDAAAEMADYVERARFSKPAYEAAARRALEFPYHLSHPVGMAVHDVGHYRGELLRPGIVLTVDPQLIIPEERRYVRVEDTVVITDSGIDNLTEQAPLDLDAIEALMREPGMLQLHGPMWTD